ncbi:MAG TPA: redoxin family protein [Polyangiaceae bacterium]
MIRTTLFVFCTLFTIACAPAAPPSFAQASLTSTTGAETTTSQATAGAKDTVFVFYAEHCPCVGNHVERLRAMQEKYGPGGVRFYFVDSEVSASPERDAKLTTERKLPFPILIDRDGSFARAANAEYASYSLVVDASGKVRYHGGIDSDKSHLTTDAQNFLADALDDLAAGRDVRVEEGKTLGCSLELR